MESLCAALDGLINTTCEWSVPRCTRLNKCIFHFILVWQWVVIADCDFTSTYLKTGVLLLVVINSNAGSAGHFILLVKHRVEHLPTTFSNWKGGSFISRSDITASNSWELSWSKHFWKLLYPMFTSRQVQVLRRKAWLYRLKMIYFNTLWQFTFAF